MKRLLGWSVALLILMSCAVGFLFAPVAQADEAGAAARLVSEKIGDAVISVRVVVKFRSSVEGAEMQEYEDTNETKATVVDPSGMAVCALSDIDPTNMMKMMGGEGEDANFTADITGLRYIMPDGKEITAKVVLRDPDLDVAVLRPAEPQAKPFIAVDLAQSATPLLLDEIVSVTRLGEVGNRIPSSAMDRITAIIAKPRTLYVSGLSTWVAGMGVPVFTLDGKIVGISVLRAIPSAAGASESGDTSMPVILPAADILAVVKQAPA